MRTGHGRERDLGTRSIFSLPWVVRSINVQYLPHPHRDTSDKPIVLIKQSDMNNSDGKASLKRQKSPETTTDTHGMSKF